MIKLKDTLNDFEDQIRLEAIPVEEAYKLKESLKEDVYVVGEGIRDFLPELSYRGFKNLWNELNRNTTPSVLSVFRGIKDQPNKRGGNSNLMYAYIDYVLQHTDAHLMIFLPKKSKIIADSIYSGPTHDEIIRALEHFPSYFERIHFVTGLFDYTSEL